MLCLSLIFLSTLLLHGAPQVLTDPFEIVNLTAPDGSAMANFIPLGAAATNLWVKDKNGRFRDILLGYDNLTMYETDPNHPNFGPVVGRYANRIRNGTFTIPISKDASGPNKFQVPKNENNGTNSLHGGYFGYDRRTWSVAKRTSSVVTFTLVDPAGEQGFPGTVIAAVTYELKAKATWKISMEAVATEKTPIMLSGHHYWNLEAYEETSDLIGHFAQFDASRVIATDGHLIPTGDLLDTPGTPLDFRVAKSIGVSINTTEGKDYCGTDCVGFDNCWIYDGNDGRQPAFSVWSINSGIRIDVVTNQLALQVYTCNGIFNASQPIPRKASHGGPSLFYKKHSCLVVEQESWIDAINNPEFGVNQIYEPGRPYSWGSTYIFSVQEFS
ncbi:galactose mutarotase-like protein [Armillaria gallica]|uniref:Galactose mutarotase-like protein n=1 Tax=Armillaria gallica TaxID=47427 RepID=A0A2H3EHP9_ARMGA|nr:galactose mutarotase-like protein [Armillaria gallica]